MGAVTPLDDATWPSCHDHLVGGTPVRHWCEQTRYLLIGGKDARGIEPGGRYCVPIVPACDLYAEVSIGADAWGPDMYELTLVFHDDSPFDPFSTDERFEPLGVWSTGEGRLQIANVLWDWRDGIHDPATQCTNYRHGFQQQMEFKKIEADSMDVRANLWCMAYYKMCLPCYRKATGPASDGGGAKSFDASSFGITEDTLNTNGSGGVRTPAQERAFEALKNRTRR